MTWRTGGSELQPERYFLGWIDSVVTQLAILAGQDPPELIQHHASLFEQTEMLFHHEACAHFSTGFLVSRSKKNDVRLQRDALPLQRQHGHCLQHAQSFHVQRTTAP